MIDRVLLTIISRASGVQRLAAKVEATILGFAEYSSCRDHDQTALIGRSRQVWVMSGRLGGVGMARRLFYM